MSKPTVVSLFSGVGGIDLAFEQAGFRIVWANEIDRYACITYRKNFSEDVLVEDDIKSIDERTIPHSDVLTAGFFTQPVKLPGRTWTFSAPFNILGAESE